MKTNTLSNLSGVNAETIRKYRDRSLLRPACNPENGYYEYSQADFLNLLYIRIGAVIEFHTSVPPFR